MTTDADLFNELEVEGMILPLAHNEQGGQAFSVIGAPADPGDMEPFRDSWPFGPAGMGSSEIALRNQYNYSDLMDTRGWDRMRPRERHQTIGLRLPAKPVALCSAAGTETASDGPRSYASAITTSVTGDADWISASNATTLDGTYAFATLNSAGTINTEKLLFSTPGFTIPGDAIPIGIAIRVYVYTTSPDNVVTGRVQIRQNGVTTGTQHTLPISVTPQYLVFTSNLELFGLQWTPDDINSANFGLAFDATVGAGDGINFDVRVDHVDVTVTYITGTGLTYLYAGGGNQLTKINLSDLSVLSVHTFAHAPNPSITDLIVLKEGSSPGDGFILIGFGNSAPIAQIDRITDLFDLYHAQSPTPAYAGVFGQGVTDTNTETLVYKSTGMLPQSTGAFSTLQSREILATPVDYTDRNNWSPATPYRVGKFHTGINSIAVHQGETLIGKPEGVLGFNPKYASRYVFDAGAYEHPDNGKGLLPWGRQLLIPTRQDLNVLPPPSDDATAGITTLLSNESPIHGQPVATAHYNRYAYVAYYTGTDTWILEARRQAAEQVTHPLIWHPVRKIANHRCDVIHICDDGAGNEYMFYTVGNDDGTFDIGYAKIDPVTEYADEATWIGTRKGDAGRTAKIDELYFYGEDLDDVNYYDVYIQFDRAGWTHVGTVNRNSTVVLTAPTDALSGYLYEPMLIARRDPTNPARCPTLWGSSFETDGNSGGIGVLGERQARTIKKFEARVRLGAIRFFASEADDSTDPRELAQTLTGLISAIPHRIRYRHHYLDDEYHYCVIKGVTIQNGPAQKGMAPEQIATIVGRLL